MSDSGVGGGMSASPKATKVKPAKEDKMTTTFLQSILTHAQTHKMSLTSDAILTTMGAKAAKMMKRNK
jgi:hypothetical protein